MMDSETSSKIQTATLFSIGARFLIAVTLLLLVGDAAHAAKRPNVIVLFADDLGYQDIGCYGGPVKTPTLDRLAAEGIRFTDFYAGSAVCGPSRAVLITGRHHARGGIYGNVIFDDFQSGHLLTREVTLPEHLRANGYSTAHFGKWHMGMPTRERKKPTPAEHGFDYWFGMNSGANPSHKNPDNFQRNGVRVGMIEGYSCQILVDEAITWLDEERNPDAPFFLNFWFHEPHDRVAAPDEIVSQYGALDDQGAIYSGTIDNTDRAIARLLDKLKEVDSLENTLIVYASDNGSYRDDRNGGLRGRKASLYEGGIRVPGIFYWPGTIDAGRVENEPAGVVDLLPTVCGLLGIDKPEGVHLDGSDISPLLTGRANEFTRHQPLFWLMPMSRTPLAIRDGKYSLVGFRDFEFPKDAAAITEVEEQIADVLRQANSPELDPWVNRTDYFYQVFRNQDAERLRGKFMRLNVFQDSWVPILKAGGYRGFELYDLSTDPKQEKNLAAQLPEVTARLKQEALKIVASVMAEGPDDWN
jgi:arylsulfatase A